MPQIVKHLRFFYNWGAMLNIIWKIKAVRIVMGSILAILGLIGGLLPVIPGFVLFIPGVVILLKEIPFLKGWFAKIFRKVPWFKKAFVAARGWIHRIAGIRLNFRKDRKRNL